MYSKHRKIIMYPEHKAINIEAAQNETVAQKEVAKNSELVNSKETKPVFETRITNAASQKNQQRMKKLVNKAVKPKANRKQSHPLFPAMNNWIQLRIRNE